MGGGPFNDQGSLGHTIQKGREKTLGKIRDQSLSSPLKE
jgi:hypothetical protein